MLPCGIKAVRCNGPLLKSPQASGRLGYLGWGDDVEDDVRVVFNGEIKTPCLVDTSLPTVVGVVVLLGSQIRVMEVLNQKSGLLEEGLLNLGRCPAKALVAMGL